MATGLEEAGKIIDETDGELTALFERRMDAVRKIAKRHLKIRVFI